MSTISDTQRNAGDALKAVGRALMHCWVAYMTWRIERFAVARLGAMSDRQLLDPGIVRSRNAFAVKDRVEHGRIASRWF